MRENYIDALSIVIPTYNRPDELKRLLKSIFRQNSSNIYEIVIVNNCSDYKIEDITSEFNSNKIRIENNPFNVRMATNMMNAFFYCKTKWMWLISDDDTVCENSIEVVNNKILNNSYACYLKFSIEEVTGFSGLEKNRIVNSLEELIDYYYEDKIIRSGNLVFISNGIFNLELLYPKLGNGFEFSYTYISFLIPVLTSVNKKNPILFCEEKIVEYQRPSGKSWSYDTVGLGLSTISHIPLNLENKYYKLLLNLLMVVKYKGLFLFLLKKDDKNSRQKFNLIYHSIYKYYLSPFQRLMCYFLSFLLIFPNASRIIFKKYV